MKNILEKVKQHKPIIGALSILVLAAGLLFTLNTLKNSQENRSKAGGSDVSLAFSPTNAKITANSTIDVELTADSGTKNITGADVVISYTSGIVSVESFTPSSALSTVIKKQNPGGANDAFQIVVVNTGDTTNTGTVKLGTFKFKVNSSYTSGVATVRVKTAQITAAGISTALSVYSDGAVGTYNETGSASPTPTSSVSQTPTPTTNGPTPTPTLAPKPLIVGCGTYGDVDGDGQISQNDANEIVRHVTVLPATVNYIAANADVDRNNIVDVVDGVYILRYLGNLPTMLAGQKLSDTPSLPICIMLSQVTPTRTPTPTPTLIVYASSTPTPFPTVPPGCFVHAYCYDAPNSGSYMSCPAGNYGCGSGQGCFSQVECPVTPTILPNKTALLLKTTYSGLSSNMTQEKKTRIAYISIFNSQNELVLQTKATMKADGGTYYGQSDELGAGFKSGNYIVKMKLDNTLIQQIPGIVTINANALTYAPAAILTPGDLNQNNQLEIADYNLLLSCYAGKECPMKSQADLNGDGLVDEIDLNMMQRAFAFRDGD